MHRFRRHDRGRPPHPDVLTPAEWRVLALVREGLPNAEIAARLGVSINTVRTQVSSMLAKLHLADRQALASWEGEPAPASRRALSPLPLAAPLGWLAARASALPAAAKAVAVGAAAMGGAGAVWLAVSFAGGPDGPHIEVLADEVAVWEFPNGLRGDPLERVRRGERVAVDGKRYVVEDAGDFLGWLRAPGRGWVSYRHGEVELSVALDALPEVPAVVHPPGTRTGQPVVDRVIEAVLARDAAALASLAVLEARPCGGRDTGDFACPEGVEPGTPVEVFTFSACHGEPRTAGELEAEFERCFAANPLTGPPLDIGLYAVFRAPGGEGWRAVFALENAEARVVHLDAEGGIRHASRGCGPTAPEAVVTEATDFLLPPRAEGADDESGEAEGEDGGPEYALAFVTEDGRVIGRHADDLEAIVEVLEFDFVRLPDALLGEPVAFVEGIVNPPRSHVRSWYGPRDRLPSRTMEEAVVVVSEWSVPVASRTESGVPVEVAGGEGRLAESGAAITLHWDACGVSFTLTGHDLGREAAFEAAAAVTRSCEAG